ncbi:YggS family pyridoxal phosphate-dependent enzyme [Helicobacter anatolicus]|uniref:YggS family pyridoxal phosphate-dependent enzyme n=1 Tax=Helicobacter anatolicus TaxID=2905874 RepID=UPI001E467650|nr:YggS family pyridoxal phosphate-dependent enzyme [Helicobacter anatolicus]MCE3037794.1 YggS family pyridoxal phosphate-dependent enzyme [Helicobacter anatolicus]
MQGLREKLDFVLQKIERARIAYSRHHIIKLVAVSKYSEVEKITELYHCGQRAFGENKVQDLRDKKQEMTLFPIEWHFIGNLQRNKINLLLDLNPFLIHSVDSLELAQEIEKKCALQNKSVRILLQVNSSYEESKSGVSPEECVEVYHQILQKCPHLKLEGLMCMGAHSIKIDAIEKSFKITKDLFDSLQGVGAKTLSMGMSNDYEIAIANGANLLRIGSEIFKSSF